VSVRACVCVRTCVCVRERERESKYKCMPCRVSLLCLLLSPLLLLRMCLHLLRSVALLHAHAHFSTIFEISMIIIIPCLCMCARDVSYICVCDRACVRRRQSHMCRTACMKEQNNQKHSQVLSMFVFACVCLPGCTCVV